MIKINSNLVALIAVLGLCLQLGNVSGTKYSVCGKFLLDNVQDLLKTCYPSMFYMHKTRNFMVN